MPGHNAIPRRARLAAVFSAAAGNAPGRWRRG